MTATSPNQWTAEEVAEQIRSHDVKAIVVKADVSKQTEIKSMFDTVVEQLGRLDIVMSNSGIEHFGAVPDVTGEEIDHVFAVNVRAQYFVAQQAYTHLADNGRLILISSISAQRVCRPHPPRVLTPAYKTDPLIQWASSTMQSTPPAKAPSEA